MTRVISIASLFFCCTVFLTSAATGGAFEIRAIHPDNEALISSEAPGRHIKGYDKVVMKQSSRSEVLWVSKEVVISTTDLKEAKTLLLQAPFDPMVEVTFTEAGSKKLAKFSRSHLNRRAAMLLDGEVLFAAVIIEPLTTGVMRIGGFSNRKEVQTITDRINVLIGKIRSAT